MWYSYAMKSTVIKVRATPEEKEAIEQAAAATGHTLSSFVRFASLCLAKKMLMDNADIKPQVDEFLKTDEPVEVVKE